MKDCINPDKQKKCIFWNSYTCWDWDNSSGLECNYTTHEDAIEIILAGGSVTKGKKGLKDKKDKKDKKED
jgi:hypothetical protein